MTVTVVNLRKEAYDVYIGRPGKGQHDAPFGNPFIVGIDGERGECAKLFRDWFHSDDPKAKEMRKLARERIKPDDKLGCFCKPKDCHGDIIAEYINNLNETKTTSETKPE